MSERLRGVAVRLHGPLQAWGGASIGDDRPTLPFPTRSGVLGLVAACMGVGRRDQGRLLALADGARVHVRVDAPGILLVDDQTIQDHPMASPTRQTIQSKRTYLCDASFAAVIVPGPQVTIGQIVEALLAPRFAPYLGRRACVPSSRLLIAEEVQGTDAIDLFRGIGRGPIELTSMIDRIRAPDRTDYYLDVPDHPEALRRIPVRDHFAGPLPRQWRERVAIHVRTAVQ